MNGPVWIWYPGDFELYHGMKQNFEREERGYDWPAFWKMDDWRKNVRFFRFYTLDEQTSFAVYGKGRGHVLAGGRKYPLGSEITLPPGEWEVEVFIGNMTGLPCLYIEGDVIRSGAGWMADDFTEMHPVGTSSLCTDRACDPNRIDYEEEICDPVSVREAGGGTLFDFGKMINGYPQILPADSSPVFTLAYGESEAEALDPENCYYREDRASAGTKFRRRAFRYLYACGVGPGEIGIKAVHTRIPLKRRHSFHCGDEVLSRVWETAAETYELCAGLFFIDGIKRDRWIWGGDAYQSFCVNPYILEDREINKRTMRALRGNLSPAQHINTIMDYTMLWLLSVEREYLTDGDDLFVREMFPKMRASCKQLISQTDENGFLCARERDWTYIDWADIDKDGCISAEQILLWKSYKVMAHCARILAESGSAFPGSERIFPVPASSAGFGPDGRPLPRDREAARTGQADEYERRQLRALAGEYEQRAEALREAVNTFFWDPGQGAYIDSHASGRRHVTRHANIFAVLFDFADEKQTASILLNVLENDAVPAITTPYFKFFELDALGKAGRRQPILDMLHTYWGGMLERGAVTFWEKFDPEETGADQYAMYGDPFGKSLCHAWGASPIYLLGKYFPDLC